MHAAGGVRLGSVQWAVCSGRCALGRCALGCLGASALGWWAAGVRLGAGGVHLGGVQWVAGVRLGAGRVRLDGVQWALCVGVVLIVHVFVQMASSPGFGGKLAIRLLVE